MNGIEGKVAIVTGGGSGLGEAIAKLLSMHKAKVIVSDIKLDGAQRVAHEIARAGGTATAVKQDTASAEDNEFRHNLLTHRDYQRRPLQVKRNHRFEKTRPLRLCSNEIKIG